MINFIMTRLPATFCFALLFVPVVELQAAYEPEVITNSIGMNLVRIEAGSFTMGQNGPPSDYQMKKHPAESGCADWDEKPAHKVTITQPFYMAATEVTLGQYRHFDPDFRRDNTNSDYAISAISWTKAAGFCEWLSKKEGKIYRLPTEAEWEYACRAGTTSIFHTGDVLPDGYQNWFRDLGRRDYYFPDGKLPPDCSWINGPVTLHVAQKAANVWDLYDMHGNLAEWCSDWYGPYEAGDQTDPLGRNDGDFRVFRGGSHSHFTRLMRSANRGAWIPGSVSDDIGFRVVMGDLPKGSLLPPPGPPMNAQNVDQSAAKVELSPADVPFFAGPKVFVKIPQESAGPLFSRHNHSPSITECPNGDLLAVWFSCVDEGGSELNNLASRLRRGSTEWEPASPFWDGADVNDHAPKLWWDGKQTLYHFARGLTENVVRTSTDNGATWSKARPMLPHGELGNLPIRTREGFIVISHDSRFASIMINRDQGQTWTLPDATRGKSDFCPGGKGFRHAGIHAPVVQLCDGRIMTIGRYDRVEDQERFAFKTPVSYSSDMGETWTYEASEFPAISSAQRAVMFRLREGPILICSFTDQARDWKNRKGMTFKADDNSEFTGYGLFAAISYDEGRTWPQRRLITPGGRPRDLPSIDHSTCIFSDSMAERSGYLSITQTRDGLIQLISSRNQYVFNLAWLKQAPPSPKP